jgi:hypothetical protein
MIFEACLYSLGSTEDPSEGGFFTASTAKVGQPPAIPSLCAERADGRRMNAVLEPEDKFQLGRNARSRTETRARLFEVAMPTETPS